MIPYRPCTAEHLKKMTKEYKRCRVKKSPSECSSVFRKCIQYTSLETEYDFLDFIGRPVPEPSNVTFSGFHSTY